MIYKNENDYDWLTNANHVAFIELNGPVLGGGVAKGFMHCYTWTENGSVSPSQVHSMECPYNQFTFDEPIMDDGVNIINFYGKKANKKQKKNENKAKKKTYRKNVASVVSVGETNEEQNSNMGAVKPASIAVTTNTQTLHSATNSIGAVKPVSNANGNYMGAVKPATIAVNTTTRTLHSTTNSIGAVKPVSSVDGNIRGAVKPAAIAVNTTTWTLHSATNSIGGRTPVSNVDGNNMGAVKPATIAVNTTTRTLHSTTNIVGAVSEGCHNDGLAPSTTFREGIDILLTLDFMQDKAEMLSCVDNFVDTQVLLASVQCLITAGKFAALGDSNVVQFKKDYHDINFGMWGNLVPGRRKVEKASEVKKLKNNIISYFRHLV
jgi:hypothetical protein